MDALDHDDLVRKCVDDLQMADRVFFLKFSGRLLDKFHEIDICDLQLDISGACAGSFHKILGQSL